MLNRLLNIFSSKESESTPDMNTELDKLIEDLNQSIQNSENSIQESKKNKQSLSQKVTELQKKSDNLYLQAANALKENSESKAKGLLTEKENVDKQLIPYKKLLLNTNQNIVALEQKVAALQIKIAELTAKKSLMISRMQTAHTQIEFEEQMTSFNNKYGLDELEDQLKDTEAKAQAMNEITDKASEIDSAIDDLQVKDTNNINTLEKKIKKEEQEKIDRKNQQYEQYLTVLLGENPDTPEDDMEEKLQLLRDFAAETTTPKKPPEDFFKTPSEPHTNREFDSFFEEPPKTTNKKEVDDFFNEPPPSEDKRIDDFFKDE